MATRTQKDVQARLDELRQQVNHHLHRYHVLDEPEISDAEYDRLFDELNTLEEEHPDLITPDSPTQRVGAPPSERFRKVEHLTPMGSLEKVTDDESLFKWADDVRKRLDSDEPVAYVIEPKIDGLAVNLTYENGLLVARRHARRRGAGRGRDGQPAHDPVDPAADAGRRRARRRGGARRGLHAALRLPRAERADRRARPEARAEPAQRRRGLAPPEGLVDHGVAPAGDLGLRARPRRGARARDALGRARVAARARLPHEPVRGAAGDDRRGREALHRLGAPPHRARLRDRRDRDQGRLARAAGDPRCAPLAAALGPRVQVGADDRADEAAQDRDPRGADRRAQPVGDARAGAGRRRHGLAGDAAQRGGHQPQGHPRGRPGDRPARRRRDPPDRRSGGGAREGDEAVPDAEKVPAVRGKHRQARGRGDAPLPQPGLPVARARDADQLGPGPGRHRGRRRAADAPALGARPRPLAARPLPADEGAAARARRLRRQERGERDRGDRASRSEPRSRASCSG